MKESDSETTAVLVNLTEQSWTLHRSYGVFAIPGCAAGEPFTLTRVAGRTATMDLGDKRTFDVRITAREVAEDLARQVNSDGGEESFFGVFVAEGDAPAEAELADARERLAAFYRRVVASADREWERSHSYVFINDIARRAAKYLGAEKDWFYQPREMMECPGCGEKIKPGVAVCRVCGAILDREKAAKLGLLAATPSPTPVAAVAAPIAAARHAEPAREHAVPARR